MCTPCNIFVRIPQRLEGKTIRFSPDLLPQGLRPAAPPFPTSPAHNLSLIRPVTLREGYLRITVRFDGHPESSGRDLLRGFDTFGKALNLALMGSLSSLRYSAGPGKPEFIVPFALCPQNKWEDVKPEPVPSLESATEAFNYVFYEDHWDLMHRYPYDDGMYGVWQDLNKNTIREYEEKLNKSRK